MIEAGRVHGLELNYAKGFKDTDLGFIRAWPIRSLTIVARTIEDLSPIYRCAETLEVLNVVTSPGARIDLARFDALWDVGADWGQVKHSIGAASGLRRLFAGNYTEVDLTALAGCAALQHVVLKDRPQVRSLDGVGELGELHHLGVYAAPRLCDLSALCDFDSLRELHVEACSSIGALEAVSCHRGLTMLNVSDCGEIESLRPVARCEGLEVLWLYGSTRIVDNDLSILMRLPRLVELRMRNRRDYRPSVAAIHDAIARA